jgi:ADP-heptose:LPS heptosyltransferase
VEILVLHPGGLGDIILSLPAIALLRRQWRSVNLTIAGNVDHLTPIMSGYAERVLSLSALPIHRLYTNEDLSPEETIFWRSYDRVVSWTGSGNLAFEKRMRELQPEACIGAWKPNRDDARHVSRLFADSLGLAIPSGKALEPARISLDPKVRAEGRRWLIEHGWSERDFLIAIHPGAGSTKKRWPTARFIELAWRLAVKEKRKLLVIEGPAEPGLARQIAQTLSTGVLFSEAAPLDLLAAVIESCHFFVGNDSGLAHLAAALDVPCLVLFGPTAPDHWAPLGLNVRSIRNQKYCEGCACGTNHHTCLENLTVEEIIDAMHPVLTRLTPGSVGRPVTKC